MDSILLFVSLGICFNGCPWCDTYTAAVNSVVWSHKNLHTHFLSDDYPSCLHSPDTTVNATKSFLMDFVNIWKVKFLSVGLCEY